MKIVRLRRIVLSAMFLGVGLLLPFLTGQIQKIGNMLLPMHIPVFLCGLICGWQYGLAVGVIMPLLRSFLFSMPLAFPNAVAMAFELGSYGFFSGFLFFKSKKQDTRALYLCMVISMIAGRIVWAISQMFLLGISDNGFTFDIFLSGAFINAVPGIIIQLILIPIIMITLKKARLLPIQ